MPTTDSRKRIFELCRAILNSALDQGRKFTYAELVDQVKASYPKEVADVDFTKEGLTAIFKAVAAGRRYKPSLQTEFDYAPKWVMSLPGGKHIASDDATTPEGDSYRQILVKNRKACDKRLNEYDEWWEPRRAAIDEEHPTAGDAWRRIQAERKALAAPAQKRPAIKGRKEPKWNHSKRESSA